MKLFYSPGACSLAPHIVLNELGLKYELAKVNLGTKKTDGSDYREINPKAYVPAITMKDDELLTEASVILQYLADQAPDKKLIPKAGTTERYRCMEWLNFIATEMHKGFGPLWHRDYPEAAKKIVTDKLHERFGFLNGVFAKQNFLLGEQYSVADAYLFTVLNWAPLVKIDLTPYPKLMGFVERVKTRPATNAALKEEGLLK